MLETQTHRARDDPNAIQLCHTDCRLEDAGRLRDWLGEVKTWLEKEGNANEVVTLVLTYPDQMPMQAVGAAFKAGGMEKYCFVPGENEAVMGNLKSWSTLGEMIARGHRLVVFMGTYAPLLFFPSLLSLPVQEKGRNSRFKKPHPTPTR